MPNTTTPAHLEITVAGSKTKLMVDPNTYSMVDITDFAPRAVSGTPTFSTLGLYLDVAQEGFNHGFGEWEFGEPRSYAYSGTLIDTRHTHIQLFTNYSTIVSAVSGLAFNKLVNHNGVITLGDNNGLSFLKPSNNTRVAYATGDEVVDLLSNGKYLFASRAGRMKLVYIAQPSSATSTTATFPAGTFESADMWNSGVVLVLDGTGATTTAVTITDSETNSITVAGWNNGTPTSSSWLVLIQDAGLTANPPSNFGKMALFGGSMWAYETGTNFVHFWSETNGSDAEGGGATDAAVITVGPPGGVIVNIFPFQNQLYVFRKDGVWVINEQDTDALAYHTLDYTSETSSSNFATVLVWNGFVIFPVRNRLYKYRSGLQDITPPVWNEILPYKQFGNFKGLIARGRHLFVLAQSNAANSDESTEATTGFVSLLAHDGVGWHKLLNLPVDTPTRFGMWLDPVNDYIYIHAHDGVDLEGYLWRIQLQTYSDLPYANFPTSGTFNWYSSYFTFGMRRIPKSFASLTLHGDFPSGTQVAAAYRVDATTSWTSLGTAFTSDMQEVSFGGSLEGKRIQIRLTLSTNSSANTPTVKALILKVMLRPDVLYGVNCDVIVSDNLSDQNRLLIGHTAAELKAALQAARDSVSPITLVDLYGDSGSAYLASLRFSVVQYEDSDAIQAIAKVTFVYV